MGFMIDFDQVNARLLELGNASSTEALHGALDKAIVIAEQEIKSELTRLGHKDTHSLYNSIQPTKKVIRGTQSFAKVGIAKGSRNMKGTNKEGRAVATYGYVLEHGSRKYAGTNWLSNAREKAYPKCRFAIEKELKRRLGL